MKRTKNTVAAVVAVLLTAGFAISPASAAVSNKSDQVDINEFVKHLELKVEPSRAIDRVAPQGDIRLVGERLIQSEG